MLENLKIDLHLPLSQYTISSLFHLTELSTIFSCIHLRYLINVGYIDRRHVLDRNLLLSWLV
jgi:hypothetical protein